MQFLRSLLSKLSPSSASEEWPDDIVPWGKYENDPLRYTYELLLEEFRHCHEDIVNLTHLQSNIVNYVILIWAALFSVFQFTDFEKTIDLVRTFPWALLILSILLSTFGFTYLSNDIKTGSIRTYIEFKLKPQFSAIIDARTSEKDTINKENISILGYSKHYVKKERSIFAPVYAVLLYVFVFSPMLSSMVSYLILAINLKIQLGWQDVLLLVVNAGIFIPISVGIYTSRKNYKSLH